MQHLYQYITCNMKEILGTIPYIMFYNQFFTYYLEGLCAVCKLTCHAGHDVTGPYFSDFFCDCAESTTHPCKAMNPVANIDTKECNHFHVFSFSNVLIFHFSIQILHSSVCPWNRAKYQRRASQGYIKLYYMCQIKFSIDCQGWPIQVVGLPSLSRHPRKWRRRCLTFF